MESAEEIERQISAQANKLNEISRRLKEFEQTSAYKAWEKSSEQRLEVPLTLWPNTPNSEKFTQSLEKVPALPAWAYDNEEKFLRRKGMRK